VWIMWALGLKWMIFVAVCYAVYEYFVALA
jgi:hypothetical protein